MGIAGHFLMKAHGGWIFAALAGLSLAACSSAPDPVISDVAAFNAPAEVVVFAPGESVKIAAFGVDGLSGDYRIGRDGLLDLGAYGKFRAAGMAAPRLEEVIAAKLAGKGHKGVRVSVMRTAG